MQPENYFIQHISTNHQFIIVQDPQDVLTDTYAILVHWYSQVTKNGDGVKQNIFLGLQHKYI